MLNNTTHVAPVWKFDVAAAHAMGLAESVIGYAAKQTKAWNAGPFCWADGIPVYVDDFTINTICGLPADNCTVPLAVATAGTVDPLDPTSELVVFVCINSAMSRYEYIDVFLAHEVGHVLAGHIDLSAFSAEKVAAALSAVVGKELNQLNDEGHVKLMKDRRFARECEADAHAVAVCGAERTVAALKDLNESFKETFGGYNPELIERINVIEQNA